MHLHSCNCADDSIQTYLQQATQHLVLLFQHLNQAIIGCLLMMQHDFGHSLLL